MGDDNIWTDTWDEGEDWSGGGARAKRAAAARRPRRDRLRARAVELAAQAVTAQARTGSQTGYQLWLIHDVEPPDSLVPA